MEISKLFVQARSATVQIADGGLYHTKAVYQLFLNGQAAGTADTAVTADSGGALSCAAADAEKPCAH